MRESKIKGVAGFDYRIKESGGFFFIEGKSHVKDVGGENVYERRGRGEGKGGNFQKRGKKKSKEKEYAKSNYY